jgi:hypothetical protein
VGYCVQFLVEPRLAIKELRAGFVLLRADEDPTLHPALRETLKEQSEFGSWTPSSVCFYHVDAVQLGNRQVAERDPRKDQMMGVWTLAATETGTSARRDLVLDMFGSRSSLIRAAQGAGIRLHDVQAAVSNVADTLPDLYSVRIGRTLLVWDGRPAGDSVRVEKPIQQSWSVQGLRAGVWNAGMALSPAWSRSAVGSLRVEGKGDLAKALKSSPIRFVGPFYRGGGGELRFSR